MSLFTVAAVVAGLYLAIVLVQAVCVWLGLWLTGVVEESRPGRVLVLCVASAVLCLLISLPAAIFSAQWDGLSSGGGLGGKFLAALPYLVFTGQVLVAWLCAKFLLDLPWGDAMLAMFIMVIVGFLASLPASALQNRLIAQFGNRSAAMAPTLIGVHADVECPNCRAAYPLAMNDRVAKRGRGSAGDKEIACYNCGHPFSVSDSGTVAAGDRILVDRTTPPRRWEMIVRYDVKERAGLVQRVVGLPGESVELAGGDVFINGKRMQKEPDERRDLWIPVHDTRYVPQDPVEGGSRWQAAAKTSRWSSAGGRWNLSAEKVEADPLVFQGRICDVLSYNDRPPGWTPAFDDAAPLVGDVELECTLERFMGQGLFGFQWEFRGQRVTATVTAAGTAEILLSEGERSGKSSREQLGGRGQIPGGLPTAGRLTLAIRDGMAYLSYEDSVVASLGIGPTGIEEARRALTTAPLPCRLSIVAARCTGTLARLRLSRDVYWRGREEVPGGERGIASLRSPAQIPENAYFLLGDNAVRCGDDSRFQGPVAAATVLGVVRWVVWPPSHWRGFAP